MDTTRVDICYRPLRVAWAILSTDRTAFREVVRHSHALWGGRFNPIVLVDQVEAKDIIMTYRADIVVPVGDNDTVKQFAEQYTHLTPPFFPKVTVVGQGQDARSHLLDMYNAFGHWRDQPHWKALAPNIRTFGWAADDPLADLLLMQLGEYPAKEAIGLDYYQALQDAAQPHPVIRLTIQKDQPIPMDTIQNPSVGYLSRCGLQPHYGISPAWGFPGFYVGDASDIRDLTHFWNLGASGIRMHFLDIQHIARFALTKPEYEKILKASIANMAAHRQQLAIWCRAEIEADARGLFPGQPLTLCLLRSQTWIGRTLAPPMMMFGEETSLGVLGDGRDGRHSISFAMRDKPFASHSWFHTQHLVASLGIRVYGKGNRSTFDLPYEPKLNEFYAREMTVQYDCVRSEPERVGIVIDAVDSSLDVTAIANRTLCEKLFELAGIKAVPSAAGLMTQQLINRMGGVDSTRAFKIGGVRRLIRQHGPTATFTKEVALPIIGQADPSGIFAPFDSHKSLFIESRAIDSELTPSMVFEHLVAKGLFRIGSKLKCSVCNLPNWYALDQLKQSNICDMCGAEFDATRDLVKSEFMYRRTGVLGLEKNAQGAIPVALLLQQLSVNLSSLMREGIFLPSFDLTPLAGTDIVPCETDFVVLSLGNDERGTDIIIGECKDAGGTITDDDVAKLRKVADALKATSLNPYILFAKLAPFTTDEIARAKTLNGQFEQRTILLPVEQLEPYHIYETKPPGAENSYTGNAEGLAALTSFVYFHQ